MTALKGADFVAVKRLTKLRGEVLADVDATCERIPAESLAGLEADGAIRRVERAQPARRRRAEPTDEQQQPEEGTE